MLINLITPFVIWRCMACFSSEKLGYKNIINRFDTLMVDNYCDKNMLYPGLMACFKDRKFILPGNPLTRK